MHMLRRDHMKKRDRIEMGFALPLCLKLETKPHKLHGSSFKLFTLSEKKAISALEYLMSPLKTKQK